MPRNKKKIVTNETKLSTQIDSHVQKDQLSTASHSPYQSLPQTVFNSVKEQLQKTRNRRTGIDGESTALTSDDVKKTHHDIWQRIGFYSNHPNHNPTAINEAYIKSMMGKSHKLGKVVAKYSLLINKHLGKRTMLMQYPNRRIGQEYRAASGTKPLQMRIKPKCGLVEVDIPVNVHENYDKEKGVDYGEAMRKSRLLQEGSSFGLGGGLGIGPKPTLKADQRAAVPEGPSSEKLLENFEDANNKGHVMNKITLGGQIHPFKNGDPIYMAATFKEGKQSPTATTNFSVDFSTDICTWTRLDAIVQLRPQFRHLDAIHEAKGEARRLQIRSERPDIRDLVEVEPEAKAVNMAVKSTEGNEEDMYGTMKATAKLLRDMRDEPWQRLTWIDQDVSYVNKHSR